MHVSHCECHDFFVCDRPAFGNCVVENGAFASTEFDETCCVAGEFEVDGTMTCDGAGGDDKGDGFSVHPRSEKKELTSPEMETEFGEDKTDESMCSGGLFFCQIWSFECTSFDENAPCLTDFEATFKRSESAFHGCTGGEIVTVDCHHGVL